MTVALFETEAEKLEYLANLLSQDVSMSPMQVFDAQAYLSDVGFYS